MRFRQLILAFLVLLISWDCSDSHVNQVSDEHRELDQSRHRHLTASTANMRREDVDRWRKKKSNKKNRATSLARIAKRMKMLSELNENTKQKLESTPNAFPSSEVKVVSPVLFYENFEINKQAIAMTDKEGNNTRRCSFLAAECEMEVIEHSLVNRFFAPEDQVLEVSLYCTQMQ